MTRQAIADARSLAESALVTDKSGLTEYLVRAIESLCDAIEAERGASPSRPVAQAIADARSLLGAAGKVSSSSAGLFYLGNAIGHICDAIESLERDEGPRLPLSADEWIVRTTPNGEPPDPGPGWHLMDTHAVGASPRLEDGRAVVVIYVWVARKREGAK